VIAVAPHGLEYLAQALLVRDVVANQIGRAHSLFRETEPGPQGGDSRRASAAARGDDISNAID
jgi:hypothetical protein